MSAPELYSMTAEEFQNQCAAYNVKLLRRPALEEWGTERYFAAVNAEALRAVEGRCRSKLFMAHPKPSRKVKLAVTRRDAPSSQRCDGCAKPIPAGVQAWANRSMPFLVCLECGVSLKVRKESELTEVTL